VLSFPQVQHRENLKGFLPRYRRLHEEVADLARPVLDVLNEEMLQAVQAQQPKGEPEAPQVMSQSSRRRRRNRRHAAGRDTKSEASTS